MTETPLHDEYRRLEAESQAAGQRAEVAMRRQGGDEFRSAEDEVLAELRKLRDDADYKRRAVGSADEEDALQRAVTERIAKAVIDRGLAFAPAFGQIRGVMIVDPSIDREARAALAEAQAARTAATQFVRQHAREMDAEQQRTQKAEFARAISEADTEAVAGILGLTPDAQRRRAEADAAMTTADLPN